MELDLQMSSWQETQGWNVSRGKKNRTGLWHASWEARYFVQTLTSALTINFQNAVSIPAKQCGWKVSFLSLTVGRKQTETPPKLHLPEASSTQAPVASQSPEDFLGSFIEHRKSYELALALFLQCFIDGSLWESRKEGSLLSFTVSTASFLYCLSQGGCVALVVPCSTTQNGAIKLESKEHMGTD